jgi:hypothetical protein
MPCWIPLSKTLQQKPKDYFIDSHDFQWQATIPRLNAHITGLCPPFPVPFAIMPWPQKKNGLTSRLYPRASKVLWWVYKQRFQTISPIGATQIIKHSLRKAKSRKKYLILDKCKCHLWRKGKCHTLLHRFDIHPKACRSVQPHSKPTNLPRLPEARRHLPHAVTWRQAAVIPL